MLLGIYAISEGRIVANFPLQEIPTLNHQNALVNILKKKREINERNKEKRRFRIPLGKF